MKRSPPAADRITIVNDSFGHPSALRQDWGFAALIEFNGLRILFDTGNNARVFAHNVDALGIDLRRLDFAVISHRHGDHTSGLNHLLQVHPALTIYTPEETYGVFGSSLPGLFFPRCHTLPNYMRYYDGAPPERIDHGSPWPDAKFVWVRETTVLAPGVHAIALVSEVPGTREMRELSLALNTPQGLVVVAGCSHPGIENILRAAKVIEPRLAGLFGGLHLVLTAEPELQRIALRLRDEFKLQRIAPGHCTGEPAFAALQEAFGERYTVCGLGDSVAVA